MKSPTPPKAADPAAQALPAVSELLILPDGRVMAHNLTPNFVAMLSELNPDAPEYRPRREAGGGQPAAVSRKLSAISHQLSAESVPPIANCVQGASGPLAHAEENGGNPKGFNVNSRGWQPAVSTARPCDPARVEPAAGRPSRSAPSGPLATCAAFRGLPPTAIHVETLRVSPPLSQGPEETQMRPCVLPPDVRVQPSAISVQPSPASVQPSSSTP